MINLQRDGSAHIDQDMDDEGDVSIPQIID